MSTQSFLQKPACIIVNNTVPLCACTSQWAILCYINCVGSEAGFHQIGAIYFLPPSAQYDTVTQSGSDPPNQCFCNFPVKPLPTLTDRRMSGYFRCRLILAADQVNCKNLKKWGVVNKDVDLFRSLRLVVLSGMIYTEWMATRNLQNRSKTSKNRHNPSKTDKNR